MCPTWLPCSQTWPPWYKTVKVSWVRDIIPGFPRAWLPRSLTWPPWYKTVKVSWTHNTILLQGFPRAWLPRSLTWPLYSGYGWESVPSDRTSSPTPPNHPKGDWVELLSPNMAYYSWVMLDKRRSKRAHHSKQDSNTQTHPHTDTPTHRHTHTQTHTPHTPTHRPTPLTHPHTDTHPSHIHTPAHPTHTSTQI